MSNDDTAKEPDKAADTTAKKKPAKPKKKPTLRQQVKELEAQVAEGQDRLLRLRAEFDNYRKRVQRDVADARQYSRIDTLETLIPVLDHFQMAMTYCNQNPDFNTLKQGMDMILAEFERSWESLGVQRIKCAGLPADPHLHEVISTEPSEDIEEGMILRETKSGYQLGDRLVRAATVVVSSGPATDETPAEEDGNDED